MSATVFLNLEGDYLDIRYFIACLKLPLNFFFQISCSKVLFQTQTSEFRLVTRLVWGLSKYCAEAEQHHFTRQQFCSWYPGVWWKWEHTTHLEGLTKPSLHRLEEKQLHHSRKAGNL